MECSNCGISNNNARLFDVISGEGIVKLCQECLSSDTIPLKRSGGLPPGKEKKQSTYERLSSIAGIKDPERHKENVFGSKKQEEIKKQDVNLRDLIDKKFDTFVKKDVRKKRDDLIENFHWVIMRARRHKRMSVSQLAKEIGEPERVVKLSEQGVLPEGYDVVMKLETILGINLLRPGVAETMKNQRKLGFDKISSRSLTISDLKEMKDNDPGMDIDVDVSLEEDSKKKGPYWRTALAKIMKKRRKKENQIIVKEIGNNNEEINEPKSPKTFESKSVIEKEVNLQDGDVSEKAEFDDTSFEITTTFPGQKDTCKSKEIQETSKVVKKQDKNKEMSQEEIDDLIFGRR